MKSEELFKQALALIEMAVDEATNETGSKPDWCIGMASVKKVSGSFKGGEVNHEVTILAEADASIVGRIELACDLLKEIPVNHWSLVLERVYTTRAERVQWETEQEENGVTILDAEKEVSVEEPTKVVGMSRVLERVRAALGKSTFQAE